MFAQGVIPDIPATAWEQAVFVTLFVVFCLALVWGLLNWFSKQQAQWQAFIDKRDTDWQGWMDRAEVRATASMKGVTEALERIGEKLDQHDAKVDARIAAAKEVGEHASSARKTVPRNKPQ